MGFFSRLFMGVSSWSNYELQNELTKTDYDSKRARESLNFSDHASIDRYHAREKQINLKRNQLLAEIKKRGISETVSFEDYVKHKK